MIKGLTHIYTGTGKGKTTSAIGLATRALGGKFKVCYISFFKNPEKYGYTEMDSLRLLGAKVLNYAKGHPHLNPSLNPITIAKEVKDGVTEVKKIINSEEYDMIIMDEIIIGIRDNYIDENEILELIKEKPQSVELILTGRGATNNLTDLADYVSNIDKIKHPYDRGITSRKGVEF